MRSSADTERESAWFRVRLGARRAHCLVALALFVAGPAPAYAQPRPAPSVTEAPDLATRALETFGRGFYSDRLPARTALAESGEETPEAAWARAGLALDRGDRDEARSQASRCRELAPNAPTCVDMWASAVDATDDEWMSLLAELDPATMSDTSIFYFGYRHLARPESRQAIRERLERVAADSLALAAIRGHEARLAREFEAAERWFRLAVATPSPVYRDVTDEIVTMFLVDRYERPILRRSSDLRVFFERSGMRGSPADLAYAFFLAGRTLETRLRRASLARDLHRASAELHASPEAAWPLVRMAIWEGRVEDAEATLFEAERRMPNDPLVQNARAFIDAFGSGFFREARERWLRILDRSFSTVLLQTIANEYATLLLDLGDRAALVDLAERLEARQLGDLAHTFRFRAALHDGDPAAARAELARYREVLGERANDAYFAIGRHTVDLLDPPRSATSPPSRLDGRPTGLVASPDGSRLLVLFDEAAVLVDGGSLRPLRSFPAGDSAEFSPDGRFVAVAASHTAPDGTADRELYVVDVAEERLRWARAVSGEVESFTWHPSSRTLALSQGGGFVTVHDALDGHAGEPLFVGRGKRRAQITFAGAEGRSLAVALEQSPVVTVWDLATRSPSRTLEGVDDVRSLRASADGARLFALDWAGSLVLWNLADGARSTRDVGPASTLSPHPTRPWLLVTGGSRSRATVLDVDRMDVVGETPESRDTLATFAGTDALLVVGPYGAESTRVGQRSSRLLFRSTSADAEGIFRVAGGRLLVAFADHLELRDPERGRTLRRWSIPGRAIAVSPDGAEVVGWQSGQLVALDVRTGRARRSALPLPFEPQSIALTSDRLAIGGVSGTDPSGLHETPNRGSVWLIDRGSHEVLLRRRVAIVADPSRSRTYGAEVRVRLAPDGRHLAYATSWRTGPLERPTHSTSIRVLSAEDGSERRAFDGSRAVEDFEFVDTATIRGLSGGNEWLLHLDTGVADPERTIVRPLGELRIFEAEDSLELVDARGDVRASASTPAALVAWVADDSRGRVYLLDSEGRVTPLEARGQVESRR